RKRHNHHFEIWKGLALILFVAIPLPFTGAWSGTVAAFIFGIPIWKAILMIGTGILISGLIVLLISITGLSLV
ncbi:MAG TPA: ligand-binding protein SH3, partial [Candidatus Wolfebacteria bacterium]|nr:ligand-binding protein SH3 [Candidatus Wolfebacteria bacterium]